MMEFTAACVCVGLAAVHWAQLDKDLGWLVGFGLVSLSGEDCRAGPTPAWHLWCHHLIMGYADRGEQTCFASEQQVD